MTWIVVLVVLAVVGYGIALYNRLVRARQMAEEGWSGIDVQLKRRADLLPNLVETVQGYATHERELLQRVTELRNQARAAPAGDVAARGPIEGMLSATLGRLIAVAENYPDLKANQNVLSLQEELTTTENQIAFSRQHYNATVRDYNTAIATVPAVFIAGMFGFTSREFFEAEEGARAVPEVNLR